MYFLKIMLQRGYNYYGCTNFTPEIMKLYTGENIEELFTRVAVVAFENVLMKEVEAEATPPPSNGQLAKNSTLIGKAITKTW